VRTAAARDDLAPDDQRDVKPAMPKQSIEFPTSDIRTLPLLLRGPCALSCNATIAMHLLGPGRKLREFLAARRSEVHGRDEEAEELRSITTNPWRARITPPLDQPPMRAYQFWFLTENLTIQRF
jgi:hypothetical protein